MVDQTNPDSGDFLTTVTMARAEIENDKYAIIATPDPYGRELLDRAYTVGMAKEGLPELIVLGIPPEYAANLLTQIGAKMVDKELVLEHGTLIEDPMDSPDAPFPVLVMEMDPKHHEELQELYPMIMLTTKPPLTLQVVWVDHHGLFPWEDGAVHSFMPPLSDTALPEEKKAILKEFTDRRKSNEG